MFYSISNIPRTKTKTFILIMKKASIIIVCGVICLAVGFFIGRSSIDSEQKKNI